MYKFILDEMRPKMHSTVFQQLPLRSNKRVPCLFCSMSVYSVYSHRLVKSVSWKHKRLWQVRFSRFSAIADWSSLRWSSFWLTAENETKKATEVDEGNVNMHCQGEGAGRRGAAVLEDYSEGIRSWEVTGENEEWSSERTRWNIYKRRSV